MTYLKFLDKQGRACNGGHGYWCLPHGTWPGAWQLTQFWQLVEPAMLKEIP